MSRHRNMKNYINEAEDEDDDCNDNDYYGDYDEGILLKNPYKIFKNRRGYNLYSWINWICDFSR